MTARKRERQLEKKEDGRDCCFLLSRIVSFSLGRHSDLPPSIHAHKDALSIRVTARTRRAERE